MPEEILSAETQEVAEPVEAESAETQEVAEPEPQGKTDADSAFAEMRRAREEAERRAEEAERQLAEFSARETAIKNLSGRDDAVEQALAEALGLDVEDVVAQLDANTESAKKDLVIEELNEKLEMIEVERQMENDLREIQKIDPSVKSLDELGDVYIDLIQAGASAISAYYATKAQKINEGATPPKPIGKVDPSVPEKDFITEAEWDAMTPAEQSKNWKLGKKSMTKW